MYKATLWLAGAQHPLRYRQQTAASSHRFGLCLGSWLAPSGIFLSNNVVDELRLSARLALLGILFKDGRRGAVVRWLSPLYCSLLLLPPFPSASLNSSGTWSGQNCAPHPKVLIKKKRQIHKTKWICSSFWYDKACCYQSIRAVLWGANGRGQKCIFFFTSWL